MKKLIILIFALIGWMLCGAIMWIGMAVTSVETTLIIHLIGAPIIFGILAFVYHTKLGHIGPLYSTMIFTGFVILMDAGLVATFIEKSFDMFRNPIGTWIPFAPDVSVYLYCWQDSEERWRIENVPQIRHKTH